MTKKFYVTTPIYYSTAQPHLGSLYSTLLADVFARWHRLQKIPAFFLTGTDEHGQKIAQAAQKAGKDPKSFVDEYIPAYKNTWQHYEISYDKFIRTTDPEHIKAVQAWIKAAQQKGDIYKSSYSGWYCTPDEAFVLEEAIDKKAPLCPSCGRETVYVSEECYFFKLSAYQDKLLQFYKENPNFIIPRERFAEVINFVKDGLRDLSISRTTISWGVPFPGDEKHVVYVWVDALINYISAIGYGDKVQQKTFDHWWPVDMHILGKDIMRFHAVYWPAFLMAVDIKPPRQLLVHGWIKVGQQKMSKSLGNMIDPTVLFNHYGADAVRYFLMRYVAVTQDTEFSIQDLENRITTDLANDLGNLLNRMLILAFKHNLSQVPAQKVWSDNAAALREFCWVTIEDYEKHMREGMIHNALARLWHFIHQVNAYFHAEQPWQLANSDQQRFVEVISAVCNSLQAMGILLWPIMPQKITSLLASLDIVLAIGDHDYLAMIKKSRWEEDFKLSIVPTLFEKVQHIMPSETITEKPSDIEEQLFITIDELKKVNLCIGTIEQCEEIPKSDKLYKLQVNFGKFGMRQILAGIKQYYKPEELIGKQATFVINLKPRMMLGVESQGMLLAATKEKKPLFVAPFEQVDNGTCLQ